MALYTRADYERDLAICDAMDSMVTSRVALGEIDGFKALSFWNKIEQLRRTHKGKLLGTRMILADNDKKAKCDDKENHNQPCRCLNYKKFKLNEAQG